MPLYRPHAYVELHIEQGPVLDIEGITIGAVEDLQGISWRRCVITGQSNHAGTTPMRLRHDAGYCAAAIGTFVRQLARELGGAQVCTVGPITLHPNLTNVIAARATRHRRPAQHRRRACCVEAERRLAAFLQQLGARRRREDRDALARALRAGALRQGHRRAGDAHRAEARPLGPADDVGRRPRRADARAHLPDGDDLRAVASRASATTRPSTRRRSTSRPAPTCCCTRCSS